MFKFIVSSIFLISALPAVSAGKGSIDNQSCLIKYAGQKKAKKVKGVQCSSVEAGARVKWLKRKVVQKKTPSYRLGRSVTPRSCKTYTKLVHTENKKQRESKTGVYTKTELHSDCILSSMDQVMASNDFKNATITRGQIAFVKFMRAIANTASVQCGCKVQAPRSTILSTSICLSRAPRLFDLNSKRHQAAAYALSQRNYKRSKDCSKPNTL